ncbi:MAG: cysteine hydrolase [Chloroflexi bacterium]|nr:MAG: cysteine hydrolase [Chloroflexota bacterium]TMG39286.1 MAG: cysteine hydrolase [Chloroflexota bacterium]
MFRRTLALAFSLALAAACSQAGTGGATTAPTGSATTAPSPSPTPAPTPSPAPSGAAVPKIPDAVAVTVEAPTTALLVLDITTVICTPRPACVASVPKIQALLKKARDAKAFVVYSQTTTAGTQVLPEVAPVAGEPQVAGRADKFFSTNLDDLLKSKGIKTAVIVGSAAHGAVLYTSFGANERGYTVVVAEDGMSVGDTETFGLTVAKWQLLNQPGFANPENKPLDPQHVTISRSDLVTFK